MQLLDFELFLPTPIDYLRRYFQQSSILLDHSQDEPLPEMLYIHEPSMESFMIPKYSLLLFAKAASVLDQAVLDYYSLKFPASVLAAAVFAVAIQHCTLSPNFGNATFFNRDPNGQEYRYPTHINDEETFKKLMLLSTGFNTESLTECMLFLQPYQPSDIVETLKDEHRIDCIQRWSMESTPFRLEEDQLSNDIDELFYGNFYLIPETIVAQRVTIMH